MKEATQRGPLALADADLEAVAAGKVINPGIPAAVGPGVIGPGPGWGGWGWGGGGWGPWGGGGWYGRVAVRGPFGGGVFVRW